LGKQYLLRQNKRGQVTGSNTGKQAVYDPWDKYDHVKWGSYAS